MEVIITKNIETTYFIQIKNLCSNDLETIFNSYDILLLDNIYKEL